MFNVILLVLALAGKVDMSHGGGQIISEVVTPNAEYIYNLHLRVADDQKHCSDVFVVVDADIAKKLHYPEDKDSALRYWYGMSLKNIADNVARGRGNSFMNCSLDKKKVESFIPYSDLVKGTK